MPVRGLLWIPIGLWSVAGLKEQGFPSMVGVRSFLVAMIQNDTHTHTYIYIYTHDLHTFCIYIYIYILYCIIYIYMYTYAYIYDPWVGSPIWSSYLCQRIDPQLEGLHSAPSLPQNMATSGWGVQSGLLHQQMTPGQEAPGIQNRRLAASSSTNRWNNYI